MVIRTLIMLLFSLTIIYGQKDRVITLAKSFPDINSKVKDDYFTFPTAMKVYKGDYYILDTEDSCIKVYNNAGKYIREIGRKGKGPGEISDAFYFAINPSNGDIYISDQGNGRILIMSSNGKYIDAIKTIGSPVGMHFYKDKLYALLTDKDKGYRIVVYKGKRIVDQYGELTNPKIVSDKRLINYLYPITRLCDYKEKLCVYSRYYPEVYLLSSVDRTVNKAIMLKNTRYNEIKENNMNPRIENHTVYTKYLYADVIIDDKSIYVLENDLPQITVYNFDGNIVNKIQIRNMKGKTYRFATIYNSMYYLINIDNSTVEIYK